MSDTIMNKSLLALVFTFIFNIMAEMNIPITLDPNTIEDEKFIFQVEQTETTIPSITEPEVSFVKPTINNSGKNSLQVYNSDYIIADNLAAPLYDVINEYSVLDIGIYAISLKDYTCIGYNESFAIDTASAVKAPFCLYVMKEIAKGNHSLNETMVYTQKYYLGGSGEIQHSAYGTVYTIEELITKCLNASDNIAYLMLQDYFGYTGYNEMIEQLGCTVWLNGYTKWGKFTAEELAIIWNEIYSFSNTCEEGEFLLDLLVNAKYNFIKGNMNRYSKVAHKSGFNPRAYNDAAIIFSESDLATNLSKANDYILVIMTTPGDSGYNSQCLAKISKQMDLIMRDLGTFQTDKTTQ